jgi:exodeoxyribonuclease VII large subunit
MLKEQRILTVTEINRSARYCLEHLGLVSIEGELSNVTRASSGHYYFTLKDKQAQLRCAFFKSRHAQEVPAEGQHIIATGRLSLYEARGDYQLIVESVEKAGIGELFRAFQQLKSKLEALGLFDPKRKKSIPQHIDHIGIITSPIGAAFHDMMTTIQRRHPLAKTYFYPSDVQGAQATAQLIQAIKQANKEKQCQVILLARGGGSLEDLWPFNQESLAYAIVESNIPIITGVGHETDFTIADFVSDYRAATPTAAAERVTPDWQELTLQFHNLSKRLQYAMVRYFSDQQKKLSFFIQRLPSPQYQLDTQYQTIDHLIDRLKKNMDTLLKSNQHRYQLFTEVMHSLSPLNTLDRGYAIATYHERVLTDYKQVLLGETLTLQLKIGKLRCKITECMSE